MYISRNNKGVHLDKRSFTSIFTQTLSRWESTRPWNVFIFYIHFQKIEKVFRNFFTILSFGSIKGDNHNAIILTSRTNFIQVCWQKTVTTEERSFRTVVNYWKHRPVLWNSKYELILRVYQWLSFNNRRMINLKIEIND